MTLNLTNEFDSIFRSIFPLPSLSMYYYQQHKSVLTRIVLAIASGWERIWLPLGHFAALGGYIAMNFTSVPKTRPGLVFRFEALRACFDS